VSFQLDDGDADVLVARLGPRSLRIRQCDVRGEGAGLDIPVVPGGDVLKSTGRRVWDATRQMVSLLWDQPGCPEVVVDLGSGTGIAGLCCHAKGAGHVVLTDLPSQAGLIEENIWTNRYFAGGDVCFESLDWRDANPGSVLPPMSGGALWIVASEVVYPRGTQDPLVDPLFDTIAGLVAAWRGSATIWFGYEERCPGASRLWRERVAQDGYEVVTHLEEGKVSLCEMRLPPEAVAKFVAQMRRAAASAAAFEEVWSRYGEQVGAEAKVVARQHCLGDASTDVEHRFVAWRAERVLGDASWAAAGVEHKDLSGDGRVAKAAREHLRTLLQDWQLGEDPDAAHRALRAVGGGVKSLFALAGGLPAGSSSGGLVPAAHIWYNGADLRPNMAG